MLSPTTNDESANDWPALSIQDLQPHYNGSLDIWHGGRIVVRLYDPRAETSSQILCTLPRQHAQKGRTVLLIGPDVPLNKLYGFLCDLNKAHSAGDNGPNHITSNETTFDERGLHIMTAHRSTFRTQESAIRATISPLADDPACSTTDYPSLRLRYTLSNAKTSRAMASLRRMGPDVVLASGIVADRDDHLQNTAWIDVPVRDLKAAAWILTLPLQAVQAWHTATFKISIITNNRPGSLSRLYRSLQTAYYFGDTVDLNINVEATADGRTLELARSFSDPASITRWQHGSSKVKFRFQKAGLIGNVVEAWWPASDHEYGFLFEDDIEASPHFYAWAKMAVLQYRYGPGNETDLARRMYGVSLIQQKTNELDKERKSQTWSADAEIRGTRFTDHSPYLSQVPSSWGELFFPEIWREYHKFIQMRHDETYMKLEDGLVTPSVVSDTWTTSWKRHLIELVFLRGYVMFYPNYADFESLSTNHVELGEHIDVEKQARYRRRQEVPLMLENRLLDLPGGKLPSMADLPIFDLWGRLADDQTLLDRAKAVKGPLAKQVASPPPTIRPQDAHPHQRATGSAS